MGKHNLILLSFLALVIVSCGRVVTKQTVTVEKGHDIVKTEKGDTTGYIVSFQDSSERKKFVYGFERLLKEYQFKRDTFPQDRYFHLKLASVPQPVPPESRPKVSDTLLALPQPALQKPEKIKPISGGIVTLYSQRGFVDQNVASLLTCYPFNLDACKAAGAKETAGYFRIKSVSDREITLALGDRVVNGAGKPLSSFDCVNAWTAFVKKHPAEGASLFRNVKGLSGFIAGQEAVIAGFRIADEKTIILQLDAPDPLALGRLCTPRLLPALFKMGPYVIKNESGNTIVLSPNARCPVEKAYLSSCVLKLGGDANPILSYSLNRYDIVSLFTTKDIEYARRKALEQSNLIAFSEDRYFLSCAMDAKEIRQAVKKCLDPRDILVNFVKAEGSMLAEIETDSGVPAAAPASMQPWSQSRQQPIPIVYRFDDPVSVSIGEKILADLTRAGLQCSLKAGGQEEYEATLLRKTYGIAVGWAPKSILFDESERLRLAVMWFDGAGDERGRIADFREIPLFSVKEYLLCKKKIGFAGDVIEGVFVSE